MDEGIFVGIFRGFARPSRPPLKERPGAENSSRQSHGSRIHIGRTRDCLHYQ